MKPRNGIWLVLVILAAGCVQILDAGYDYQLSCTSDDDCDDRNPCTVDGCSAENICRHESIADSPLPQQIAGDCRRDDCVDGEIVSKNDDDDTANDNEPCKTNACYDGNPIQWVVANDTPCSMGMSPGTCMMGVCSVECGPSKPCDDQNPCTNDSCHGGLGICTFSPLDGIPTPGIQEVAGDCLIRVCEQGVDVAINDPADVPDDMNSCTLDVCTDGVGSSSPVSPGTTCVVGEPGVCDGSGACVECNEATDCVLLPVEDDCQKRTCIEHLCSRTFTMMGTVIAMQTMGDCKRVVCDGMGGTRVEIEDTDLPEDNNPCTKNICANGVPTNPTEPLDTDCGVGAVCNSMGMCVGCNMASQCTGTDDFCKTRVCIDNVCAYDFTPAGTDLPMGQTNLDCMVVECDGMGNIVNSVDQSDRPVDGNECTQDVCSTQGIPSNPFEPVNATCNQTDGTVCDGAGTCKKAIAAVCAAPGDCLSGFCVDGVCCDLACSGACKSCNIMGMVGTCSNVAAGQDDGNGVPSCSGPSQSCDGMGACKKENGQTCSAGSECSSSVCVDGYCCNNSCTAACQGCNVSGYLGTCHNLPQYADDANPTCSGTNTCNGAGACLKENGQTCTSNGQCASTFCVDGYCCNNACTGLCQACSAIKKGSGANGTCGYIASGTDPDNECNTILPNCNGAGACSF